MALNDIARGYIASPLPGAPVGCRRAHPRLRHDRQIRDVGVGLALGVLMDTFIVRTVLVPCTVILLGRWNWWPSAMSRADAQPPAEGSEPETEPAVPRRS